MKKTLAAATFAVLGVAGAANAADVYSPAPSLKDVPYVAVPSWTGFYIGAHVGGAFSDLKTDSGSAYWGAGQWSNNADGVVGGGQLGYNYQFSGNFVMGFEADFGGMGLSNSQTAFGTQVLGPLSSKVDSGFYTDVTGRLGYAVGPALFYAKGGWVYYDGALGVTDASLATTVKKQGVDGWTVGGGIEYKFAPTWSVKGEYRYFDFGDQTVTTTPGESYKQELKANTVTVGLNYFVGGLPYSPLK